MVDVQQTVPPERHMPRNDGGTSTALGLPLSTLNCADTLYSKVRIIPINPVYLFLTA